MATRENEVMAIPGLLSMSELKGVVMIGAMGCQKSIHRQGVKRGRLCVGAEGQSPDPWEGCALLAGDGKWGLPVDDETAEKGDVYIETRRNSLSGDLEWLAQKPEWRELPAVYRAESICIVSGKSSTEHRYFRWALDRLERFAEAVRGPWSIENLQHWGLDG